ncbi:O-antigen ligase family protein [Vibrio mimicus]|uniref:O-antigen ligase family protein n=1 Tax=Vibrio mimicus TaxID=674 RepID=UPI0011D72712|nr:O-antigen ligase family protein [Vibrio mimicus]TXZ77096.1 O-antigen ligase family protein [Vibrio mimicus]
MFIRNKLIKIIEQIFLLSPLVILLMAIFNFSDTKFILSRLIPIVCIYCLFRYRQDIKDNFNSQLRLFFVSGLLVVIIFSIYHFVREDEFSLPRTLIASLAYLIFVPWKKINIQSIYYVLVIASIVCGVNAFYEYYVLNIARVGVATNPIPYALYISFLILCCIYFLLINSSIFMKVLAGIGSLLLLAAVIMTDVRGVIVFLPIAIFYLIFSVVKLKWRHYVILSIAVFTVLGIIYTIFQESIDARIKQTQYEFAMIDQGNYKTSIGIRLELWRHGLSVISNQPIFGLGDKGLTNSIASMTNRGAAVQPHLHNQYLDFLARYGLVGTLAIILFCLSLIFKLTDSGLKYIGDPLVNSILITLFFAGLTDVPLHHTHIIYLLTILCGLLICFSEMRKDSERYMFK